MPRREEAPTFEGTERVLGDKYTHPAYGCVTITRPQGQTRLFGSDLVHNSTVRMTVYTACDYRGYHDNRHMSDRIVCEVEMSEPQWSRLVASAGMGGGVPVTFTCRTEGQLVECPGIASPQMSKKDLHGHELEQYLRESLEKAHIVLTRLREQVKTPGSVSKKELASILHELELAIQHLPVNAEFAYRQFREATETVVEDAKAEVEAFVLNLAVNTGLEQLRNLAPSTELIEGPDGRKGTEA